PTQNHRLHDTTGYQYPLCHGINTAPVDLGSVFSGSLHEITSPFARFGQTGRDDSHSRAALGVGDSEHAILDHPERAITMLAIILTPVLACHGKGVIEGEASCRPSVGVSYRSGVPFGAGRPDGAACESTGEVER